MDLLRNLTTQITKDRLVLLFPGAYQLVSSGEYMNPKHIIPSPRIVEEFAYSIWANIDEFGV